MHPFLDATPPIAIAHRGGTAEAPENSLAAFAHAVSLGYQYLETDVHATTDGVLVVSHDPTLDRTTTMRGAIAELGWQQVSKARIDDREPVARLDDVLGAWPHARVVIDCKDDAAVEPLARTLRDLDVLDRVCVGSFSQERLARLRALLGRRLCTSAGPDEVRRLLLAAWRLLPRGLVGRGFQCVQIPTRHGWIQLVNRRMVAVAHALGRPLHVWTVNERAEMHRLLDLGVDGIVTDRVSDLRAVLVERGAWPGPATT